MVVQIIQLAIYVAMFVGAAVLVSWMIQKYQLPQWVLWICGGLLLIILLLFLASQFGGGTPSFNLFPRVR